jgi:hypothetical protein
MMVALVQEFLCLLICLRLVDIFTRHSSSIKQSYEVSALLMSSKYSVHRGSNGIYL